MSHLSATEMISELNSTNMTQFEISNGLVYRQPKSNNERRLSPWLGKRRYSKSNKFDKKGQEEEKVVHSQKTEEFLKKIFPRKRHREMEERSLNVHGQQRPEFQKIVIGESPEESGESSFVFLPIKPINFEKLSSIKQNSHTERKKQIQQPVMQKVEPQIFEPPCKQEYTSHRSIQSPKASSLVFTFCRSWRKKERVKTEPAQDPSKSKRRISIDEIYRLLGKDQQKTKRFSFNLKEDIFEPLDKGQSENSKSSSWLVPRSMKGKKNTKFKTLAYKTQYI